MCDFRDLVFRGPPHGNPMRNGLQIRKEIHYTCNSSFLTETGERVAVLRRRVSQPFILLKIYENITTSVVSLQYYYGAILPPIQYLTAALIFMSTGKMILYVWICGSRVLKNSPNPSPESSLLILQNFIPRCTQRENLWLFCIMSIVTMPYIVPLYMTVSESLI